MYNLLRWIARDWPWKLLALFIALAIFFSVRKSISYTQTLTLPVEALTHEGSKALTGFVPSVVSVTLRGSEQSIRQLSLPGVEAPKIKLKLDQPPADISALRVQVTRHDISGIEDLKVVNIEPRSVVATFDISDTRVLPVEEPILKGVPEGISARVVYTPHEVSVTGSKARLAVLQKENAKLTTPILDVSTKTENFHTTLKISPPDNKGGWRIDPPQIEAEVFFTREDTTRVFNHVPVNIIQSEKSDVYYITEVQTVDVTIEGTRREVDAIEPSQVKVLVRELRAGSLFNGGRQKVVPEVILPYTRRVEKVTVSPDSFFIRPLIKE